MKNGNDDNTNFFENVDSGQSAAYMKYAENVYATQQSRAKNSDEISSKYTRTTLGRLKVFSIRFNCATMK